MKVFEHKSPKSEKNKVIFSFNKFICELFLKDITYFKSFHFI